MEDELPGDDILEQESTCNKIREIKKIVAEDLSYEDLQLL